ncbi:unnamed protein product, partial [Tetraodon nigroviridis]
QDQRLHAERPEGLAGCWCGTVSKPVSGQPRLLAQLQRGSQPRQPVSHQPSAPLPEEGGTARPGEGVSGGGANRELRGLPGHVCRAAEEAERALLLPLHLPALQPAPQGRRDDGGPDGADAAEVQEVTAFSQECLEKIDRCLTGRDYQEVLALCSACLQKQRGLLADTHLCHLRVLSAAVEALSYLRCFPEAAAYALRLLQGYRKLYPPNHAQLGVAAMRVGVAHLQAGMPEAAHELICQAYRTLLVSHGPNHSTTRDLE